ncbi:MAG: DUF3566 domain-containing protein [Nocardioidaceae bacterium]|nr:DUF3566 domain-containing protein [Nocardioidaceae bacterium]
MSESVDDTTIRPAIDDTAESSSTPDHRSADSGAASTKHGSSASAGRGQSGTGDQGAGTATATPARSSVAAPRGPRRARLRLTQIDPWTVMKTSFLLSIAFAVVTVVSVAMVWQVLGAAGVWDSINSTIQESIGGEDVAGFRIEDYLGTGRVLGFTMLVAAIDVVLITAAATLIAFLYNMSASLLGGVEITLSEDAN